PPRSTPFPYTTLFRSRGVLVDVDLAVEPQILRVCPQEPTRIGVPRDRIEVLLLEGPDVLRADLRPELDLGIAESLPLARLPEARSEEHTSELQSPYDL